MVLRYPHRKEKIDGVCDGKVHWNRWPLEKLGLGFVGKLFGAKEDPIEMMMSYRERKAKVLFGNKRIILIGY